MVGFALTGRNQKSKIKNDSVVHSERCVGIVLVPYLVYRFAPPFSHVKSVGAIDYDAVNTADILI